MKLFVRVLVIVLVVVLGYPTWVAYRIWRQSHIDEVGGAGAIVVLGAAQYNGKPSPVFKARLDHALYLYSQDLANTVIVTGGRREGDRFSEAESGAAYLESQGISASHIMQEGRGRTTLESLRNVWRITRGTGIDSVLLVSDPLHSERIKIMATDLGFRPAFASWASYQDLNRSRRTKFGELVHEVGALVAYELFQR